MPDDVDSEEEKDMDNNTAARWRSCRYLLSYWCFLGSFCMYALRSNLSLTIVCMVNQTQELGISDNDPAIFPWTRQEQSFLLGAFYYGYVITGVPAGWIADRYGGRMVLVASVLVSGVSTVLMPLARDYFLMLALRVLTGFMCGAYLPALSALFAKWSPSYEIVRLGSIAYSGAFVGAAVSLAITGILCQAFDWRSVLYVTGTISIVWSTISLFLIRSKPAQCRCISKEELKHIQKFISPTTKRRIPWKIVLTSMPIYSVLTGFCLALWYDTVETTGLNLYIDDILHVNIIDNGIQTAIPQLVLFVTMLTSVFLSDKILQKCLARPIFVRKTAQAIGGMCQIAALMTLSFLDHNYWIVAILMFNLGRIGFSICIGAGYRANMMDIAPQLAGTIMGLGNTVGVLFGFLCPVLIGFLTSDRTKFGWQLVFYISSGIIFAGTVFFLIFASDKPIVLTKRHGRNVECKAVEKGDALMGKYENHHDTF